MDNHDNHQIISRFQAFEWLTNFSGLSHFLAKSFLWQESNGRSKRRTVLHVGCGSSTLGESLLRNLNYDVVVNADVDNITLRRMEKRWDVSKEKELESYSRKGKDKIPFHLEEGRLLWQYLDFNKNVSQGNALNGDQYNYNSCYDLVLDKSTLDCALCSDSAGGLIRLAHESLNPLGGVYFVISFHHVDFILPLLRDCPGCLWNVEHHVAERKLDKPGMDDNFDRVNNDFANLNVSANGMNNNENLINENSTVNVFICRRHLKEQSEELVAASKHTHNRIHTSTDKIDIDVINQHIHRVNDEWFKVHNPMVTHRREDDLKKCFVEQLEQESCQNIHEMLPLDLCYNILFTDAEREQLTYNFFLEDWRAYVSEQENDFPGGEMTCSTAVKFLAAMQ